MSVEDRTLRALAEPSRRRMVELVRANPGISVGHLAEHFEFSRYAAMKHLGILERAGLIERRADGRARRLYHDPAPIRRLLDAWRERYGPAEPPAATSPEELLRRVFVIYIRATPEQLWEALTNPGYTAQYYYGARVRCDFEAGASLDYLQAGADGAARSVLSGTILACDPPRRLAHTFAIPSLDDRPSRVTYSIEPLGDAVRLTVTHDGLEGETRTYRQTRTGWPPLLSSLKSLLETGAPLKIPG